MFQNPKVDLSQMIPLPPGIKRTPGGQPIPPKWTNVMIATSAASPHQAVGRDEAGRIVYIRSSAYTQKSKDKKYTRLKSFMETLPKLVSKIQADAKKGKEEARVLDLIYKTGFRVDSGGKTKAKVQAFGASGLLGKHVQVSRDTLRFNFPSKKGGTTKKEIKDPTFAKLFKDKEPDQKLFNTNYKDVTKYWKKLTNKYPIKDLRLYKGTSTAIAKIKTMPMPTTVKEYKTYVNEVCDTVAEELQNTRAVAKGSYIMPAVFSDWNVVLEGIRALKAAKKKKNPDYAAVVTDKETKKRIFIERNYDTKAEFIFDLRRNGYAVDPSRVKTKEEFDRIMNTTNLEEWDWKPRKYDLSKKKKNPIELKGIKKSSVPALFILGLIFSFLPIWRVAGISGGLNLWNYLKESTSDEYEN